MYTVSTGFRNAVMSGKPQKLKLTFGENQIAEQNLSISGLTYSSMAFEDEELTIGAACSAELGVELLNFDGGLSSFNFDGTEFTASIGVLVGEEYEYVPLGVFISEKPDKLKPKKISITAHDRMVKFDVSADAFLNSLSYPTTLKNIFTSLCAHVGVPASMADFPNSGKTFDSPLFRTQDVLCREVLQWIAEAACSFARISRSGVCELAWFTDADVTFNKTANSADYYNAVVSEYQVAKIDKLQVAASEKDIGVIVGTGTNAYQIIDCPMLYGYTDAQIRPYAEVIYNRLNSFAAFTPVELDAKGDWSLEAGDMIKVVTDDGTYTFPIYRMDLTFKGRARIQYISSGSPLRPAISAENRRTLIAGRAAHEIEMTVEGLKQTVSKTQFLTPVLSDTDPSAEWEDPQNFEGYQWFDGTDTRIWDGEKWLLVINPDFRQTATPTATETGQYWYNPDTGIVKRWDGSAWVEDTTVTIPQTWASSMQTKLEVTAEGITSSVTKDNIISTINQSAEQVKINAGKITLEGVVTANSYFKINADGSMTTTNATIAGKITATSGSIGGFDIGSDYLSGTNIALRPSVRGGQIDIGAVTLTGLSGLSVDTGMYIGGNSTVDGNIDVYGITYTEYLYLSSSRTAGSSSPTAKLVDKGNGYYSLGYYSSRRDAKKDITAIGDECSEVMDRLRPVYFRFKEESDDTRLSVGFIAEEVEEVCPEIVCYDSKGNPLSVQYANITALLVAEVQRLRKRIDALEEQ